MVEGTADSHFLLGVQLADELPGLGRAVNLKSELGPRGVCLSLLEHLASISDRSFVLKICLIPSDLDAPGCYRLLFPAQELRKRGHDVKMPPYDEHKNEKGFSQVMFKLNLIPPQPDADVYVFQQAKQRIWAEKGVADLKAFGKVVVSEIDDNYEELPTWNPAFVGTHPYRRQDGVILNRKVRRGLKKQVQMHVPPNRMNREWMNLIIQRSDGLTVSTPYLADIYSRYNRNIKVIRNYLNWEMWKDVTPQYEVERDRLRIGWMGAAQWRGGDLGILREFLRPFLLKHPEIDFVAAGSPEIHDMLGVPEGQRVTYPYTSFRDFRLPEITAVMDIGLVPMVLNGLNEAKSHLKGMEYNACGIPFIASPTESYKEYWCDEGENGFLAANTSEWMERLEEYVADDALRREMGRKGREKAMAHTLDKHVHEWEDFYQELIGDEVQQLARKSIRLGAIQKAEELSGLLRVVQNQQPKVVVEIGTAQGGTFNGLCKSAHPKATVISIDMPGADFGFKREDTYGKRNVTRMSTFGLEGQDLHFLRGNSQLEETREALEKILDGRQIEFLFIDGDHSYQGVKRDYELYSPLVDGFIGFHDIVPHPFIPETQVHKLWRELKGKKQEFLGNPHDDRGWGAWGGVGILEHKKVKELV